MKKRTFLSAAAVLAAPSVLAQRSDTLLFAINEGVTYKAAGGSAAERFADLSADLQKLLKRPVRIQIVDDYKELAQGTKEQRYDLAYIHPAHHAMRAVAESGYQLVALTKGFTEYRASFMVTSGSPVRTIADLKGRKIGAPSEDSITSVITRATLREMLGALPEITYVRYQDAVPFMVENSLVACGVSASRAVVKGWQDKGGRVVGSSRPVPIKHLLAGGRLAAGQRAELTAYFTAMDQSAEGRKRLESLKVAGFAEGDPAALAAVGKWLAAS